MHVFENGEQLLVKTADGILHKLNIIDNETHRYDVGKDKSLVFTMENSGREYKVRTKDAEVLDYQLMDKLLRAICLDTKRT